MKLPKRTRENMLAEWDENYSQVDREGVAYQLHLFAQKLTQLLTDAENAGLHELASEFERKARLYRLVKTILAFDPDKEDA